MGAPRVMRPPINIRLPDAVADRVEARERARRTPTKSNTVLDFQTAKGSAGVGAPRSHGSTNPLKESKNTVSNTTAGRKPATYIDLETGLNEAFQFAAILADMLDEALDLTRAVPLGDGGALNIMFSRQELDQLCFMWNQSQAAASKVKEHFYEITRRKARGEYGGLLARLARNYSAMLALYEQKCVPGLDNEACDRLASATFLPYLNRLETDPPPALSFCDALAGLRLLLTEAKGDAGENKMAAAMLPSIIAFLEARS